MTEKEEREQAEAQRKYDEAWLKASYEVMGWTQPSPLSDKDFEKIDIACGEHEISTGKPNPPWFYEKQIVKAVIQQAQIEERKRIAVWMEKQPNEPVRGLDEILRYQFRIPKDQFLRLKRGEEVK